MYFEEKRKKLSIEKNWKRAIKRAVIIGATVEILKEINQKVHLYGTSRNMMIKGQTRELAGGHRANSKVGGGPLTLQIIHPDSSCRRYWDAWIALLLIYTAVVIPFRVAFEDATPLAWLTLDLCLDFVFILDIIFNFITGYRDPKENEKVVLKCRKLATHYLKGWFILDFISTFPFQIIEVAMSRNAPQYNKLLRLLRLPRLYRLLKVAKCLNLLKRPGIKRCF